MYFYISAYIVIPVIMQFANSIEGATIVAKIV